MKNHSDDKLEKLIHRELSRLPDIQAPETLLPRVLGRILADAQLHWWQRPWFHWPTAPRMLSLLFAVGLVSLVFSGVLIFGQDITGYLSIDAARSWFGQFSVLESLFTTLASAVLVILNTIGTIWLILCLTMVSMAYFSCVGIGTVCFRLAINTRQTDEK